ncbi:MAG TPA: DUF4259 domain-containing protein [Pseudonocardiaceae bacterium]|nr:DUF4259 domain-containing protein [Pseudonocardiaceae bacterium]
MPDDLRALTLRALDRVQGDDSMWRELWEEADRLQAVKVVLAPVRAALASR